MDSPGAWICTGLHMVLSPSVPEEAAGSCVGCSGVMCAPMRTQASRQSHLRDCTPWTMGLTAMQTETFDAEMEGLASNVKKKGKLPARHGHLEESISRHKQHIVRLEQMLRLLDNEVSHHHAPGAPVAARPCHFSLRDLGPESHSTLGVPACPGLRSSRAA